MREIPADIQEQIEKIRQKCSQIKPCVVIHSLAYNHGPYIREALEGFVNQRTDFSIVAVVHDDASTDNTAVILREYAERYPDIILPIFESENQYSNPEGWLGEVMKLAMEASGALYIAMCECDDYWTDPLKLQKQVDFLEANPEYGASYSKINSYLQYKRKFIGLFGEKFESFESLLLKGNVIPTLSVVFRKKLWVKYNEDIKPNKRKWLMGDYPIWLYFAYYTNWHFLNEVTGCYRILQESAAHSTDSKKLIDFTRSYYEIRLFYAEKYGLENYRYILYSQYLWNLLCVYAETHDRYALKYLRNEYNQLVIPVSLRKYLIKSVIKLPILHYCLFFYKKIK